MNETIIDFLKNEENLSFFSTYFVIGIITFAIMKYLFISSKILLKIFSFLIYLAIAILFFLIIGNIVTTHDYVKFIHLTIILIFIYFLKQIPQIVKWYDSKIDSVSKKIK